MTLRVSNIAKLREGVVYDALIIGGGINGAVSAAALSGKGAQVALIDKRDFAGFTSQQSSNLAWGGIKYLESGDYRLVRKLCLSRNELIRSYPSRVKEIRFFSKVLINAAGPFVDDHNQLTGEQTEHQHLFSKGEPHRSVYEEYMHQAGLMNLDSYTSPPSPSSRSPAGCGGATTNRPSSCSPRSARTRAGPRS